MVKNNDNKRAIMDAVTVIVVVIATALLCHVLPATPEKFGVLSIVPAVFLVAYIFVTKRVVEGLILASVIGVMMVSKPEIVGEGNLVLNSFNLFNLYLMDTMLGEDTQWLIIVCGLMGSIIALIEKSGGAYAFGEWAAKKAKTQKSSLMWTWFLGIIIFIDDYLNSLTVGACMTKLTDKYRTPREYLAYIVDSTAAPACAIIPVSTWAVFVARILEINDWAPEGDGLTYFIKTIPFNFYAWIALLIVPLVIWDVIPMVGSMKKAVERVSNGGSLAPEGSEKIDIHHGKDNSEIKTTSIWNMIIPIVVLIGSTAAFGIEMQYGVIFTVAFLYLFYLLQNVMNAEEFVDTCVDGFKNMLLPLLLMVLAFLFARVNSEIHFTEYVITSATKLVVPKLVPVIIFIALSITEFITGTNWGMYVIALPIVIPLAKTMGVNIPLTVAAVLSAGVFGSHICFYSDATVVTSAATGCDNMQHAVSQLPYGLIAAAISAMLFLIAGIALC